MGIVMGKSIRKKRSFRKHRINPRKSVRKSMRKSVRKKSSRRSVRKSMRKRINYNQKKYNLIGGVIFSPTGGPSWILTDSEEDRTYTSEEEDEEPEVQQIIKKALEAYGKAKKVETTEETTEGRGDNSPPSLPERLPRKGPYEKKDYLTAVGYMEAMRKYVAELQMNGETDSEKILLNMKLINSDLSVAIEGIFNSMKDHDHYIVKNLVNDIVDKKNEIVRSIRWPEIKTLSKQDKK